MRERALQPELHGVVRWRRNLVGRAQQGLPESVPGTKSTDAGRGVAAAHGFAVVEPQPLAKRKCPAPSVIRNRLACDHLRLRDEALVQAVERIEHKVCMVA